MRKLGLKTPYSRRAMSPTQQAQALTDELSKTSLSLNRCACGAKAVMAYDPGCTRIHCLGCKQTKAYLPEWQPTELARRWNTGEPAP
jgi:hypothetical protein